MKNEYSTRHESDSTEPKEEPGLYEYLDGLEAEIGDLTGRLRQIKAVSIMSRRSLEKTLACSCCAEDILHGVFSAIENIAVTVE
ncbi:MAG: hypothetical protein PHY09_06755 [Desulfuromonadaceae bacterium]|nr:hypothetical protein [Desulfuromonadaceae bacterium]MDD5104780.1 hypothetical protein [Desulfuromonadaceae bacterium]